MSATISNSPTRTATAPSTGTPGQIDARGPQFAAALTAVLLGAVLLTGPSALATGLLVIQAGLFAWAVARGVQSTPHAWLFKNFVRPRLSPTTDVEDPAPPRFAQAVGLAFALVGVAGFLSGADTLGLVATGFALTAALLNAVFRFCLGCEMYLGLRRIQSIASSHEARTVPS